MYIFAMITNIFIFLNERFKLLNNAFLRRPYEGLNSIKYKVAQIEIRLLYTKIIVIYNKKDLIPK